MRTLRTAVLVVSISALGGGLLGGCGSSHSGVESAGPVGTSSQMAARSPQDRGAADHALARSRLQDARRPRLPGARRWTAIAATHTRPSPRVHRRRSVPLRVHNPSRLRALKRGALRRYRAAHPRHDVPARSDKTARLRPAAEKGRDSIGKSAAVFDNLNRPGLGALDSSPSDSTGAIGPNHYVEMVNSRVAVYARSGLRSQATMDLAAFVGASGNDAFDPQVQWDPSANRWFYVADLVGSPRGSDYIALGWSKTSDPSDLSNGWCRFVLNTDDLYGGLPGDYFDDYPKLGHSDSQVIVGANLFGPNGGFSASILTFPKPPPGAETTCPSASGGYVYGDPSNPLTASSGVDAATPVPADITDSSSSGYVVSSDGASLAGGDPDAHGNPEPGATPNSGAAAGPITASQVSAQRRTQTAATPQAPPGAGSALTAWQVDDSGLLSTPIAFGVPAYGVPADAPQPDGGLWKIATLDTRMTQAVGHSDPTAGGAEAVWTQHTVDGG